MPTAMACEPHQILRSLPLLFAGVGGEALGYLHYGREGLLVEETNEASQPQGPLVLQAFNGVFLREQRGHGHVEGPRELLENVQAHIPLPILDRGVVGPADADLPGSFLLGEVVLGSERPQSSGHPPCSLPLLPFPPRIHRSMIALQVPQPVLSEALA
jgi:hypothetical protein